MTTLNNEVSINDNIFRQYDIRGVYDNDGNELTDNFAELLGKAYVRFLQKRLGKEKIKISIGRDIRLSGGALRNFLMKGITAYGGDVVDIGKTATPLEYFSIHHLDLDGGVMITGSHNPPEYNGFKISAGKETIHGEDIQELKKIMAEVQSEDLRRLKAGEKKLECGLRGNLSFNNIKKSYIEWIKDNINITKTDKPVKIVIDAGNGTGGLVAPELLKVLEIESVDLFCEPDGTFPNHHPDPTVEENLDDLKKAVLEEGAAFGVGFDGDSDRIGVVDEKGNAVWGDELMVIFSRDILKKDKGATIVGEVKCSQNMYDEIEKCGGVAVMWKTGHSVIKSKMKELDAALAGEMSGHIFFADRYFGFDDAFYAMCRLLEIYCSHLKDDENFKFSTLLEGLPSTVVTPELRVDCDDEKKFKVIDELKKHISTNDDEVKKIIDIDGVRVVFENGWGLVRASNTQPVLVFRFEASDENLLKSYIDFMQTKLSAVDKNLKIKY